MICEGIILDERFIRTMTLWGEESFKCFQNARVAVFGLGGVGGYVVEALARSGFQNFDLVDNDTVSLSNLNRQIIALYDNVGQCKTEAFKERILKINENAAVNTFNTFFLPENSDLFDFTKYDYVVDAIDTVSAKIALAKACQNADTMIISSMGTGNKLDPTKLEVSDIYKTSYCHLARVMRNLCKKNCIKKLKVVYSTEQPKNFEVDKDNKNGRHSPASCITVPATAGLLIASEVMKDIANGVNGGKK